MLIIKHSGISVGLWSFCLPLLALRMETCFLCAGGVVRILGHINLSEQ